MVRMPAEIFDMMKSRLDTADLRQEYDAFIEQLNKNYSFINSFLEVRLEWKKMFLQQREKLAWLQENRSKNYGRKQSKEQKR